MKEYELELNEELEELEELENMESDGTLPDSVKAYLQEIGQFRLLTAEEEQKLSLRVQAGLDAEALMEDYRQGKKVLDLDSVSACQQIIRQGQAAQATLVNANLRLVVVMAKKYLNRGLPLLDLIQEGNLGLMKAAQRYDGSTGNRFSTCAAWWIRQTISRAVTDNGRTIRLPSYVVQEVSHLRKATRELRSRLGHEPSVEEIAAEMKLKPQKVRELIRTGMETTSLDLQVGEDDGATLADFVGAVTPMDGVEDQLCQEQLRQALGEILARMDPRERQVLTLRYGLNGGEPQTLEAVGREMGITRERARQIEGKALRKLRSGRAAKELAHFIA